MRLGLLPAAVVLRCSSVAAGQWLYLPTPGVPRTADGQPNLVALPPRSRPGRIFLASGSRPRELPCTPEKAYTRPWTVDMPLQITLDTELIDEICLENEKSSQRMGAQ